MSSSAVDLGEVLPNHFDQLASFVGTQVGQLSDLAAYLDEHAAIERDYAAKVQTLVRKARTQRDRRLAELCVGSGPHQAWNPADPSNKSTYQTFFTKVLDNQEAGATAHDALAEALGSVVSDLKRTQSHDDGLLKAHIEFQRKLRSARDTELDERVRTKSEYDEATQVVEAQRHRVERREASEKSSDKALKNKAAAELEMKDAKNAFLIAIAVANKANGHYFGHSLPALEQGLQRLWLLVTEQLTGRLERSNQHFLTLVERTRSYIDDTSKAVNQVDATRDQALYAQFNRASWAGPEQWSFEPYPTFYDTPDFVVEPDAHAFLENRLIRARQLLRDVNPQTEKALGEYQTLLTKFEERTNPDGTALQLKESCLVMEDDLLVQVSGDIHTDVRPHTFKPTTFKIPASCAVCSSTVWGINKQAVQCQACGVAAHHKCAFRLPAECSKSPRKSGALGRVATTNSLSTYSSRTGSIRQKSMTPSRTDPEVLSPSPEPEPAVPVPTKPFTPSPAPDRPKGQALYAFDASSPNELSVADEEVVWLIVPDDGSGWSKVANSEGRSGFVPSAYVDFPGPEPSGERASAGRVRALYDFEASAPDELSLHANEVVQLTPLGRGVAEGWIEGIDLAGSKGIFPASYVEDVD